MSFGGISKVYNWTRLTNSAAFHTRDGAGGLYYNNKYWLLGGWRATDSPTTNSQVWNSTDGITWTQVTAQADWEGRHGAGYVVFNNKMWIIGGDANRDHYQPETWSSTDGVTWTQEGSNISCLNRQGFGTVVFNNEIYIIGGQKMPVTGNTSEALYNDVYKSSDGITFTQVTANGEFTTGRRWGGVLVFNNKMWVMGGGIVATATYQETFFSDVWSSTDGSSWTQASIGQFPGRLWSQCTTLNGKMWIIGGLIATNTNSKTVFTSVNGVNWQQEALPPLDGRHAYTLYENIDDRLIAAGTTGIGTQSPLNDVWKMDGTVKTY